MSRGQALPRRSAPCSGRRSTGVTPLAPGRWLETDLFGERELTDNELAHEWAYGVLTDEELAQLERLRNGLGLLDLLDDYSVTPAVVGDDVRELREQGQLREPAAGGRRHRHDRDLWDRLQPG